MSRLTYTLFFACAACAAVASADDGSLDKGDVEFFEKRVRPILVEHCYECHSHESEDPGGGLLLDSRQGWMDGGYSGSPVMAGKPDESLLVLAVKHVDAGLQMPPGSKLPQNDIDALIEWIRRGAPDPRQGASTTKKPQSSVDIEAGRQHWAFMPPERAAPPQVEGESWCRSAIDRFLLADLEEKGLRPAAPAPRWVLFRRATFDLLGLPPTPEQMSRFLSDESPDAFGRAVDRLLASPRYGERWARHWLDVARYADSNGLDENIAHGNAWRYRDYVVAAFNEDVPYDRFVMQQLAGDLLPSKSEKQRVRNLIGAAFLSLGPKVLAESDEEKMRMDIIDEQIDTFGKAFLGLTLGCARCHDHKFDPIPTTDYYALAGIFKSTRTMESYKRIARWHEHATPTPAEMAAQAAHEQRKTVKREAIQASIEAANGLLVQKGGEDYKLPKNPEASYDAETKAKLAKLRKELAELEKSPPEVSSVMAVAEDEVVDVAVHIRGSHRRLGEVVPRRFPQVLADPNQPPLPTNQSGRLKLAEWMVSKDHPLTARVMVNRVWRWHFGEGLTPTTDNFGRLGETPVNQPLLDELALGLVQDDWSIKNLHRRILLSSAYRMSGEFDEVCAKIDPENRHFWRFTPRRLEAEEIRDSLLAVSGSLDLEMGGSMLNVGNREFIFNHTSEDNTTYQTTRRSIYLPVVRNHLCDTFSLFDYPDPAVATGDRSTTTVAPQALYVMNSEAAWQAAMKMARSVLDDPSPASRIQTIYRTALGREAEEDEVYLAGEFIARFQGAMPGQDAAAKSDAEPLAWQAFCQAVLASNEFFYIQ